MISNCLDISLLLSKEVADYPEEFSHPVNTRIVRSPSRLNGGVVGRAESTVGVANRNYAGPFASRASYEHEFGSSTNWQCALLGRKACSVAPAVPGVVGEKEQYADI